MKTDLAVLPVRCSGCGQTELLRITMVADPSGNCDGAGVLQCVCGAVTLATSTVRLDAVGGASMPARDDASTGMMETHI